MMEPSVFLSSLIDLQSPDIKTIVEAIKDDHRDLKRYIVVLKNDKVKATEKRAACKEFMSLLKSHASSEQKVLYERCLSINELKAPANEGFVEHELADKLMKSLKTTKAKNRWLAEAKVLAEIVEHHIQEEESEFLPKVENYFKDKNKQKMADQFIHLRERSQQGLKKDNAGVLAQI